MKYNSLKTFVLRAGLPVLLSLSAVLLLPSCSKEAALDDVIPGTAFCVEAEEMGSPLTRSHLTASGIESMKTGVTLAAYTGGKLYSKAYFSSSLTNMTLPLRSGKTYNVYALVNMGDMTSFFSDTESNMKRGRYAYTSYSSMNSTGIPMSGSVTGFSVTSSTTGLNTIPVKRLLAKVTANLNCTWGGTVTNAYIRNMSKYVYPFGSAVGSTDNLTEYEIALPSGSNASSSLQAVFYVPENGISSELGSADGYGTISSSHDKSLDNEDVDYYLSLGGFQATYLEVSVAGAGDYDGSVTYRSILGENATTDFDVIRNTSYIWNVTYYENGLQYNDWKVETDDLTGERYVYYLYDGNTSSSSRVSSISIGYGQYVDYYVYRFRQDFSGGAWVEDASSKTLIQAGSLRFNDGTGSAQDVSGNLTAGGTGNVFHVFRQSNNLRMRGLALGSSQLALYIDDSLTEVTATLNIPVFVVDYVSYGVVVSPSEDWIYVGETVQLSAVLNRYLNGVLQGSVSGVTFSYSVDDYDTGSATVSSSGLVTGVNSDCYDLYGGSPCYVYATCTYGGQTYSGSASIYVEEPPVTYELIITDNTSPQNVGDYIYLMAYFVTYTNGVETARTSVTTSVSWRRMSGGNNSSAISVDDYGWVTSTAAATATIRASYTYNGTTYYAYTEVVFEQGAVPVTSVSLNESTKNILVGQVYSGLTATVNPSNATDPTVTWSSGNTNVATVDSNGVITGVGRGSATITATAGGRTASCMVYVGELRVEAVENPVLVGSTAGVRAIVRDYSGVDNYVTGTCTWSLSGSSLSGGSTSGNIRSYNAVSAGTTTVTASYSGSYGIGSASVAVLVESAPTPHTYSLVVDPSTASVVVGGTVTLNAYLVVDGVRQSSPLTSGVSWSSSSSNKATVSGTGACTVTGVAAGSAVITAGYSYSGQSLTATATVTIADDGIIVSPVDPES